MKRLNAVPIYLELPELVNSQLYCSRGAMFNCEREAIYLEASTSLRLIEKFEVMMMIHAKIKQDITTP